MGYALAIAKHLNQRARAEEPQTTGKGYSITLKQTFEVTPAGAVQFKDGIEYSFKELELLKGLKGEHIKAIHLLKQTFGGTVIKKELKQYDSKTASQ